MNKETVYAFVDSQNLNLGIRNDIVRKKRRVYKGWQLDFEKFFVYLKHKYSVDKAFLFIGKVKGNDALYKSLLKAGYTLVFKKTITALHEGREFTKGNVDAELVLHSAKIEYDNYQKAVIVSGDGDFYCLHKFLNENRKLQKILVPNQYSYSTLLAEFKSFISFVNQAKAKLEYRKGKQKGEC